MDMITSRVAFTDSNIQFFFPFIVSFFLFIFFYNSCARENTYTEKGNELPSASTEVWNRYNTGWYIQAREQHYNSLYSTIILYGNYRELVVLISNGTSDYLLILPCIYLFNPISLFDVCFMGACLTEFCFQFICNCCFMFLAHISTSKHQKQAKYED